METSKLYPHTESNCNPLLRRQVLYPLSYGGNKDILLNLTEVLQKRVILILYNLVELLLY